MSIYIIRSKNLSLHDIYVGSCKDMRSRMSKHKTRCCNENDPKHHYKVYQFIRANGGWDNFIMEEIDNCNVERLYQMEQEYIDKYNPSLNSNRAYISEGQRKEYNKERNKEWHENNKEYRKEYKKEYYKNNKEYYSEKFTCDCGGRYTRGSRVRHFKTNKHQIYIQSLSSSDS